MERFIATYGVEEWVQNKARRRAGRWNSTAVTLEVLLLVFVLLVFRPQVPQLSCEKNRFKRSVASINRDSRCSTSRASAKPAISGTSRAVLTLGCGIL